MLTVGLPLYRSKDIAWLALEGLCNQIDAPEWELIIIEEDIARFDPFGAERLEAYQDRLYQANCQAITYIPIKQWIPLAIKWKKIAELSIGDILLLQAGDCYGQPYRLRNTGKLMEDQDVDWYQAPRGYFYLIKKDQVYEFTKRQLLHPCALNMAMRMTWVKLLPEEPVAHYVDGWLFRSMEKVKLDKVGSKLNVVLDEDDTWQKGIDTHGLDNLSVTREKEFDQYPHIWIKQDIKIEQIVPKEIAEKIKALKSLVRTTEQYRIWEQLGFKRDE